MVALLAASATPAAAHDGLVGSQPAGGSVVAQAPSQAVLTFSADVQQIGTTVELQDTAGTTLSDQAAVVEGRDVVLVLPAQLDPGELRLVYRVTSSDGHPISGAVPFTLEPAATSSPEQTLAPGPTPEPTPEPMPSGPAQPPSTFPSVTTSPSAPQADPTTPQAGPATGAQAATAAAAEGTEGTEGTEGRSTTWLVWGSVALALLAAAVVAGALRRKRTP